MKRAKLYVWKCALVLTSVSATLLVAAKCHGQTTDVNNAQTRVRVEDVVPVPPIFIKSVIFGIEAGTLVGLAGVTGFQRNIREHAALQNIARGASWGLYGGIILGLYLAYWYPWNQPEELAEKSPETQSPAFETPTDRVEITYRFKF